MLAVWPSFDRHWHPAPAPTIQSRFWISFLITKYSLTSSRYRCRFEGEACLIRCAVPTDWAPSSWSSWSFVPNQCHSGRVFPRRIPCPFEHSCQWSCRMHEWSFDTSWNQISIVVWIFGLPTPITALQSIQLYYPRLNLLVSFLCFVFLYVQNLAAMLASSSSLH